MSLCALCFCFDECCALRAGNCGMSCAISLQGASIRGPHPARPTVATWPRARFRVHPGSMSQIVSWVLPTMGCKVLNSSLACESRRMHTTTDEPHALWVHGSLFETQSKEEAITHLWTRKSHIACEGKACQKTTPDARNRRRHGEYDGE